VSKKKPPRKSSTGSARKGSARKPTVAQLRGKIKRLDKTLVELCQERASLVCQLNESSTAEALRMCDASNVGQILGDALQDGEPLAEACLRATLRELFSGTRAIVSPVNAAYLGPPYSFSHLAAAEHFGESAKLVPVSTIAAVFEEVQDGQVDHGLVPLENSTDGRIVDTLDMFARVPVKICGEVRLRIHHHLLSKCSRADIRDVYSKPQAISQCRNWLAKHMPHAQVMEIASTAAAAELAASQEGVAAIASHQAGTHYGLDVIAAAIEDNQNNITRFAVIGRDHAARSGNDKTALMFEVSHQPGALADVMNVFKRSKLNLTFIESFPRLGGINEYIFFVEFEGHPVSSKVRRALDSLDKKVVRRKVLGAYENKEPVG